MFLDDNLFDKIVVYIFRNIVFIIDSCFLIECFIEFFLIFLLLRSKIMSLRCDIISIVIGR